MVGFADGEGDILLATNIIESGLDVPRANTMIVWRPDRFGLSQLHQLEGASAADGFRVSPTCCPIPRPTCPRPRARGCRRLRPSTG